MAAAGTNAFTKENENYFRLSSLLLDTGSDILREVFLSYYSHTTLKNFLSVPRNSSIISSLIRQGLINNDQKDLLCPAVGYPDVRKFDISLLYMLIRNLSTKVNACKLVWTKPSPKDFSLEADVARIRQARNMLYGHMVSTKLSDQDFQTVTADLSSVFLRVVQNLPCSGISITAWQQKIDAVLSGPFDSEGREDLLRRLNAWYAGDVPRELQEIKEDLNSTKKETERIAMDSRKILSLVHGLSDSISEVDKENMRKRIRETNLLLDQHQNVHDRYGIRLKSTDRALEILQEDKQLILTGGPGSGKTFMAKSILLELRQSGRFVKPLRVNSVVEWMKLVDIDEELIVFIDDFLGKYGLNEHEINDWRACSDLILSCLQNGNVKMIATIRTPLLKQVVPVTETDAGKFSTDTLQRILLASCTLDISSGPYKITFEEKDAMLHRYIEADSLKIETEELSDVCRVEGLFGFPQCCRMLKFRSEGTDPLQIFKEHFEFLRKELEHLFRHEKFQYAVLAMTMLFGGILDLDEIQRKSEFVISVFEAVGLSTRHISSISPIADHLCDVFLKRHVKKYQYSFAHDTIHAAVFQSFGHKYCIKTLQLCSLDILSKVCRAKTVSSAATSQNDTWGKMEVSENNLSLVVERFIETFQSGRPESFQKVSEAAIWVDISFRENFFQRKGIHRILKLADHNGHTLLVHAAASGNTAVVESILHSLECCLGEMISEVEKALEAACRNHKVNEVLLLLNLVGRTPDNVMFIAAKAGNVDIMRMLIAKQGQLTCTRSVDDDEELVFAKDAIRQECVLHVACFNGKEEMVKFLLEECNIVHDVSENFCLTPLHLAAASGIVSLFDYLVSRGYNPMCVDDVGSNILQFACIYGKEQMTEYVCKKYPDMIGLHKNKPDKYRGIVGAYKGGFLDSTAIHSAAAGGNIRIFQQLVSEGADPYLRRNIGDSCMSIACNYGKTEMIKYLGENYPEMIHSADYQGWAPIHFAARESDTEVIQYFLEHQADPESTTFDGRTILHIACHCMRLETVDFISSMFPALINRKDDFGWAPIHCAAFCGSIKILNILLDRGADINMQTKFNRSARDIALDANNDDAVLCLRNAETGSDR